MIKKYRLPEPKFAFAKKAIEDSNQSDDFNSENRVPSPEQGIISERISYTNKKVEYTRITAQITSQIDRRLEYAVLILDRKKQDLINELLYYSNIA
jgi:hypothetical protein